jgi:hypothetical protein
MAANPTHSDHLIGPFARLLAPSQDDDWCPQADSRQPSALNYSSEFNQLQAMPCGILLACSQGKCSQARQWG